MKPRYLWLLVFVGLISLAVAVAVKLRHSSYEVREDLFMTFAKALLLTPALFLFVPRRWLKSPRVLLFTWWILPVGVSCVSISYLGDMGDSHMFSPTLVLIAGFWAMFAPIIVVGVRRAMLQRKLQDSNNAPIE